VWGDHQTADHITSRVPLIVYWPGIESRIDTALHYQFDWAATLLELAGAEAPDTWDAQPFTESFRAGRDEGRPYLVLSQGAWSCMRSVRWDDFLCLGTYHDGCLDLEPVTLFDVRSDPHQLHDFVAQRPELVDRAMRLLTDWQDAMMRTARHDVDPLMTVLREGGPWQLRGHLAGYLKRLRATGREDAARRLEQEHAGDLDWERTFLSGQGIES
jgi:choline-sulfatase